MSLPKSPTKTQNELTFKISSRNYNMLCNFKSPFDWKSYTDVFNLQSSTVICFKIVKIDFLQKLLNMSYLICPAVTSHFLSSVTEIMYHYRVKSIKFGHPASETKVITMSLYSLGVALMKCKQKPAWCHRPALLIIYLRSKIQKKWREKWIWGFS